MKTAIFASLFATAAAFAPAQQKASSSALGMAFENELGAQPPVRVLKDLLFFVLFARVLNNRTLA